MLRLLFLHTSIPNSHCPGASLYSVMYHWIDLEPQTPFHLPHPPKLSLLYLVRPPVLILTRHLPCDPLHLLAGSRMVLIRRKIMKGQLVVIVRAVELPPLQRTTPLGS